MFREGRELRVILSPEHHFKNSSKREKGEGEARMSESLIYADLNLTEPTRPRLQNVTDEGRFNRSALSFLHIRHIFCKSAVEHQSPKEDKGKGRASAVRNVQVGCLRALSPKTGDCCKGCFSFVKVQVWGRAACGMLRAVSSSFGEYSAAERQLVLNQARPHTADWSLQQTNGQTERLTLLLRSLLLLADQSRRCFRVFSSQLCLYRPLVLIDQDNPFNKTKVKGFMGKFNLI